MQPFFATIASTPKEAVAVLTALLAAIVALVVVLLTQIVLSRRETTRLLTQKLEELYVCAVRWRKETGDLQTQLEWYARGTRIKGDDLRALIEKQALQQSVELIAMYVELYFPRLRRFSVPCWDANRDYQVLLKKLANSVPVTLTEVRTAAVGVQKVLGPLRSEIGRNRDHLTRSKWFKPRYEQVE